MNRCKEPPLPSPPGLLAVRQRRPRPAQPPQPGLGPDGRRPARVPRPRRRGQQPQPGRSGNPRNPMAVWVLGGGGRPLPGFPYSPGRSLLAWCPLLASTPRPRAALPWVGPVSPGMPFQRTERLDPHPGPFSWLWQETFWFQQFRLGKVAGLLKVADDDRGCCFFRECLPKIIWVSIHKVKITRNKKRVTQKPCCIWRTLRQVFLRSPRAKHQRGGGQSL